MELASLAQLERSHRRHDDVMAELLDAARRFAAGRPDPGDLDLVRDAVAYFARAATRHFVDEEGSVFPRLSTRRPELAQALAELSAEHPAQIAMHAEVAAAAHDLDGDARPNAGKTLLDAANRLAEAHHAHVVREDEIFATAHEALTAEDDAEIVAEMEMRRGREDGGGGRGGGGGGGGRGGGGGGRGGGGGGGGGRGGGGGGGGRGGGGGGGGRGGGGGGGGGGGRGRERTAAKAASPAKRPPARTAAKVTTTTARSATRAAPPTQLTSAAKRASAAARTASPPAAKTVAKPAKAAPAARGTRAASKAPRRPARGKR